MSVDPNQQPESVLSYYKFKRQLLSMMTYCDPLQILESNIFEHYEARIQGLNPTLSINLCPIK
jgi:hypothetical protein